MREIEEGEEEGGEDKGENERIIGGGKEVNKMIFHHLCRENENKQKRGEKV